MSTDSPAAGSRSQDGGSVRIHRRRHGILGVCAIDTSVNLGADITGFVDSMAASFTAHLAVETTDTEQLKLRLKDADEGAEHRTFTISY